MKSDLGTLKEKLAALLPHSMCQLLFKIFIFDDQGELDSRQSAFLWNLLLQSYFPYLRVNKANSEINDPILLKGIFLAEIEKWTHLKNTFNRSIPLPMFLLALSGELDQIQKSSLSKKEKSMLCAIAFSFGHCHAYFKLSSTWRKVALELLVNREEKIDIIEVINRMRSVFSLQDKECLLIEAAKNDCQETLTYLLDTFPELGKSSIRLHASSMDEEYPLADPTETRPRQFTFNHLIDYRSKKATSSQRGNDSEPCPKSQRCALF